MIYHYAFIIHQKQRCVNTPFDFFLKKTQKDKKLYSPGCDQREQ